jgi:regulator of Ty1 transposition protein 103
MYLANDVIQNSKKKGPEYGLSFTPLLGKAFKHIAQSCDDDKTFKSLARILDVWGDREVYEKEMVSELKSSLNSVKSKKHQSSSSTSITSNSNSKSKEESSSKKRKTEESSSANGSEIKKPKTTPSKAKILEVNGETHVTLSPTQPVGDPPEPEELIKMLESLEECELIC